MKKISEIIIIVSLLFFTVTVISHAENEHIFRLKKNNPVHMVVTFSKFKDEAPGDSLAPAWAKYIFDGTPGSVPHYYNEISFGQIKVTGEYLPKIYELPKVWMDTFFV